ncbi:VaFE repeat-containing surface-anchored protein, partial [Leucobacter sp. M11]|uniref:VaFE repeat-containing surface-anchored protein n=1 Tax=Leucobacter sp. M11 TaxID=2993565 RepID=UPI002D7FE348
MTRDAHRQSRRPRSRSPIALLAAAGTAALLALGGAGLGATSAANAAPSPGPEGQMYGVSVPGQALIGAKGPIKNGGWTAWSGTYQVPGGGQGYCADHGLLAPNNATGYAPGGELTTKSGTPISAQARAELAYILYASNATVRSAQNGGSTSVANETAAAASYLLHELTGPTPQYPLGSNVPAKDVGFDAAWYRAAFLAKPATAGVVNKIDQLRADGKAYAGPWTLTVRSEKQDPLAGETVPFTASVTARNGAGVPGVSVALAAEHLTGVPGSITTGRDGTATFSAVLGDRAGSVTASASAPADSVRVLRPTGVAPGKNVQRIVVVEEPGKISAVTQAVPRPATVTTSAGNQVDGDRVLPPEGGVIVDRVSYTGLLPGATHTLRGELFFQDSAESTGITAERTFVPETRDGVVDLEFTVPPGYGGRSLVVYEWVSSADGRLLAEHTDIDDEAQTVTLDPVELSTSASDQADGDRVL